jgi:oxygen-independent coproporphyrinogen-3 oxidase
MAGIYIHIPFCKQACSYCNFHFSTSLNRKSDLVNAIKGEIKLRHSYLKGETIETIYFGGGTPSLLEENELKEILEAVYQSFKVEPNCEITLEANPDDLTLSKLKILKFAGINRLSIGVQSFHEEDLTFMNRSHNSKQAVSSIKNAQEVGFSNLNLDLIFGSQTTSDKMWSENLHTFFSLDIPHLSAYSLTIEEKTALAHRVKSGKSEKLDEDKNYRHYQMLLKAINENGFQQYELSNYCKGENISKHNSSYWFEKTYLGIGPSAHSFNRKGRQWNVSNNLKYINAISNRKEFYETEELSEVDRYHEYLITSLRTKWGVEFKKIEQRFSKVIANHFYLQLNKLDLNLYEKTPLGLKVKPKQLFQSDEVVRTLMI